MHTDQHHMNNPKWNNPDAIVTGRTPGYYVTELVIDMRQLIDKDAEWLDIYAEEQILEEGTISDIVYTATKADNNDITIRVHFTVRHNQSRTMSTRHEKKHKDNIVKNIIEIESDFIEIVERYVSSTANELSKQELQDALVDISSITSFLIEMMKKRDRK